MPAIQRMKYQTDAGSIFNVLLDASSGVQALVGLPPTGAYTENMTIRGSKNNKEVGIAPRYVLLAREVGNPDADPVCLVLTGERYKRLPVPTKATWDAIVDGSSHVIGGTTYTVKKKISEKIA